MFVKKMFLKIHRERILFSSLFRNGFFESLLRMLYIQKNIFFTSTVSAPFITQGIENKYFYIVIFFPQPLQFYIDHTPYSTHGSRSYYSCSWCHYSQLRKLGNFILPKKLWPFSDLVVFAYCEVALSSFYGIK